MLPLTFFVGVFWALLSAARIWGFSPSTNNELKTAVAEWVDGEKRSGGTFGSTSIADWDTSRITETSELFMGKGSFNEDIGKWNVSQVTLMNTMFRDCGAFNQDIGQWDTSRVGNMVSIFDGAVAFNQDISKWNTAQVTQSNQMLRGTKLLADNACAKESIAWQWGVIQKSAGFLREFGREYDTWWNGPCLECGAGEFCTAETMKSAAQSSRPLCPAGSYCAKGAPPTPCPAGSYSDKKGAAECTLCPIGTYGLSTGQDSAAAAACTACPAGKTSEKGTSGESSCFEPYTPTNLGQLKAAVGYWIDDKSYAGYYKHRHISTWDTSRITEMKQLFYDRAQFNDDIGLWNVGRVTQMNTMFMGCGAFNQDIGKWDTSQVDGMHGVFMRAAAFNQDISKWNTARVNTMINIFNGAKAFNQDISKWNTAKVMAMHGAFDGASSFSQDLGAWDTRRVRSMYNGIFRGTKLLADNACAKESIAWRWGVVQKSAGFLNEFGREYNTWWNGKCLECGAGELCTAETSEQDPRPLCPAGSYCPKGAPPTPCPAGMYNDQKGAVECTSLCRVGTYGLSTGMKSAAECQACPAHKTSEKGTSGESGCFAPFIPSNKNDLIVAISQWITDTKPNVYDNRHISTWDTSRITDMRDLLSSIEHKTYSPTFNEDIGAWDTSQVTSFSRAFSNVGSFNQDIGKWNTSRVKGMDDMFKKAKTFNQDIGRWDTSSVTNMKSVFYCAEKFNQFIGDWDIHNVAQGNFDQAFYSIHSSLSADCTKRRIARRWNAQSSGFAKRYGNAWMKLARCPTFVPDNSAALRAAVYEYVVARVYPGSYGGQDIADWDTSRVTNMNGLFCGAEEDPNCNIGFRAFDENISSWDTSRVMSMKNTFRGAASFNSDIGNWDTHQVANMELCFDGARSFNQDIGSWVTSEVTTMKSMFRDAASFNSDIRGWDTRQVRSMESFFEGARSFNQHIGSWVTSEVTIMKRMFSQAPQIDQDLRNWSTSRVTSMAMMFEGASGFNGMLGKWDTGRVHAMDSMFAGASVFNQDIGRWDTNRVTSIARMFAHAQMFNQDIGKWDTGGVEFMDEMFQQASAFNQNIRNWNVSQVVTIESMFEGAAAFNQNLRDWDVSRVKDFFSSVFETDAISDCTKHNIAQGWSYSEFFNIAYGNEWLALAPCPQFSPGNASDLKAAVNEFFIAQTYPGSYGGQHISLWDTSRVKSFFKLFCGNRAAESNGCHAAFQSFNEDVSAWDTSRVTNMAETFRQAAAFDRDIGKWDTSNVKSLKRILQGATAFNQDIGTWDTSMVSNLEWSFHSAAAFNQNLGKWNTSQVTSMQHSFALAGAFDGNITTWDTRQVKNMNSMFHTALMFNQDIGKFDTSRVISMQYMFYRAPAFDQNIGNWDTRRVTDMGGMFSSATAFNKDIKKFDTSRVRDMSGMFAMTQEFNQDIASWNASRVANMLAMFYRAHRFNQNIGGWNTVSATDMSKLFHNAVSFNQDIGLWVTRQVTAMRQMFQGASSFDQSIAGWDVTRVKNMSGIFDGAGLLRSNTSCSKAYIARVWGDPNTGSVAFKTAHSDYNTWQTGCSECAPGYWCANQGMYRCDVGFWCPANTQGREQQRSCPNGTYANPMIEQAKVGFSTQSQACSLCPVGRYFAGHMGTVGADDGCNACDAGHWCPGVSQNGHAIAGLDRLACPVGKYAETWATGFVSEADVCTMCPSGWFGGKSGQVGLDAGCGRCPNGAYSVAGAPGCFFRCLALGYYWNDATKSCTACPRGTELQTLGAADRSDCTACKPGYVAPNEGTTNCQSCGVGSHSNAEGTACLKCEAGTVSLGAFAECTMCPAGTAASAGKGFCTDCLPGTFSSTVGSSECTSCSAGKFSSESGQSACVTCKSGTSQPRSSFCKVCLPGTYLHVQSSECRECKAGTFAESSGQTTCVACISGTSQPMSSFCKACLPGTYLHVQSSECRECKAGTFAESSGQTTCVACAVGTSKRGASYCADCEAGLQLNRAVEPPVCAPCPAGTVSSKGNVCEPCGAGMWAKGQVLCALCPPGTWSNATGASNTSACRPCPTGSFSSARGVDAVSKCNACPPGKRSDTLGAGSSRACTECREGRFAPNSGQTACDACTNGTASAGSSYCTACDAGKELLDGGCVPCPAGTTSKAGGMCLSCEVGRYAPAQGMDGCTRCPDFMTSRTNDATKCIAAKHYVLGCVLGRTDREGRPGRMLAATVALSNGVFGQLHLCPDGAVCEGGARIETLELQPGFTRPTDLSLDVAPCKDNLDAVPTNDSVCTGGASTGRLGESVCRNGTAGPYCAVCAMGYTRQGDACVVCADLSAGDAVAPLFALIGIAVAIALSVCAAYKLTKKKKNKKIAHLDSHLDEGQHSWRATEKIKLAMSFVQVVTGVVEESGLLYPPFFARLAASLSIFSFDVFGFLSIGCVLPQDFYSELVVTCVSPLVLALPVGLYANYVTCVPRASSRTKHEIFTSVYLIVLFCVYPGVTRKVFNTFKCERFVTRVNNGADECADLGFAWEEAKAGYDHGLCYRSFLRADLSLSCDAPAHSTWKGVAGCMVLIYPLGVPALFAWLLRRSHGDDESLVFIRAAYEDEYYWWELVEVGRKLVITLTLVFFMEGSASQIVATMLIACTMFTVLRTYKPYKLDDDDALAATSQALLVLVLLAVLCIKLEVNKEDDWNESAFDVAMSVSVMAVPILGLLLILEVQLVKRMRRKVKVAVEELGTAEETIEAMKAKLRAATELVDKIMNEGGSLLGSYAIKHSDLEFNKMIGEGSFGEVWKGRLRGTETVAIKTMRMGKIKRRALTQFKKEVIIMAPLRHANLVCMRGAVWTEGADKLCLVLEFAEWGGLDDFMETSGFTPPVGRSLVLDVALCLKYLHHDTLNHKPANVLVTSAATQQTYLAKVADFGESRNIEEEELDVSFGLTAIEVLSGEPKYILTKLTSKARAGHAIYASGWRPPVPASVAADVADLLKECMLHDPAERPDFVAIVDRLTAAGFRGEGGSESDAKTDECGAETEQAGERGGSGGAAKAEGRSRPVEPTRIPMDADEAEAVSALRLVLESSTNGGVRGLFNTLHIGGDVALFRLYRYRGFRDPMEYAEQMLAIRRNLGSNEICREIVENQWSVHTLPDTAALHAASWQTNDLLATDSEGDIVSLERWGAVDPVKMLAEFPLERYAKWTAWRHEARAMLVDALSRRVGRVVEFVDIMDLSGASLALRNAMPYIKELATGASQGAIPIVLRVVYVVGMSSTGTKLLNIAKRAFMTKRQRLLVHAIRGNPFVTSTDFAARFRHGSMPADIGGNLATGTDGHCCLGVEGPPLCDADALAEEHARMCEAFRGSEHIRSMSTTFHASARAEQKRCAAVLCPAWPIRTPPGFKPRSQKCFAIKKRAPRDAVAIFKAFGARIACHRRVTRRTG